MVQITATLVAAAIIVPAIAAPVIESREPFKYPSTGSLVAKVTARAVAPLATPRPLRGREKIEARSPVPRNPGHVNSNSNNPAANVVAQGKATKGLLAYRLAVAGAAKDINRIAGLGTQKQPREFELDARDPRFNFGKVLKTAGRIASNFIREDEMDLAERDLEDNELEARRFNFGKVFKTVEKVASNFIRDEETGDIYVIREVADIDELD